MHKAIILLFCFLMCSALHLMDSRINATVKDVLNAACPGLPKVYITNPQSSRWVYGDLHPAAYNSMIESARQNNRVVKCPWQRPFSTGIECINCHNNQVFNLQTKQCEDIPPSFVYDEIQRRNMPAPDAPHNIVVQNQSMIHPEPLPSIPTPVIPPMPPHPMTVAAQQYFTDLSHPNLISNGRPFAEIQQEILHNISLVPPELKRICPSEKPFFNGKRCRDCPPQRPYFNLQSRSCMQCTKGTVFSKQKHKCEIAVIKYLTSPDAPNIQYGSQSEQNYRNRFNAQRQHHPVCPEVTPYFNGERCISCNPQYPVFNLERSQCVSCPPPKVFSPEKNRCVSRTDVFPTIERYLMNIK